MAYTIKLGAFAKLENSTARPASSSWAEYSVVLKEGSDYTDPVLHIAADFSAIASAFVAPEAAHGILPNSIFLHQIRKDRFQFAPSRNHHSTGTGNNLIDAIGAEYLQAVERNAGFREQIL